MALSSSVSIVNQCKTRAASCAETIDSALKRISDNDPSLGAFITVSAGRARQCAARLDKLDKNDIDALPLFGLPVALKDNLCVKGLPATCASNMLKNFVAPYDAAVTESLERAGAVIIGKTNMDEFAMGSTTETSAVGVTHNPHDPERIPGGSSGGSAAAVAGGLVSSALGSDTGGSIRQPCSHCGVPGLKPTYGRISRYGLIAFASSLDQIGPICADIRDIGLMLSVLSAPDDRDSTCAGKIFDNKETLYDGNIRGMKIGVPKEYFGEGLDGGVRDSLGLCMKKLEGLGAELVDVTLPNVKYAIATYYIICTAEASSNLARFDGVKYGYRSAKASDLAEMYGATRSEGFGPEVKRRIMLGTFVLSSGYYDAYYLKAAKVRTLISMDFEKAFTECDAVISPVAPTVAFKTGEKCEDPLQMYLTDIYTVSANLAGIPAISVPCGDVNNLPVGAQFMAPRWREDTLVKLGYAVQEACWKSSDGRNG